MMAVVSCSRPCVIVVFASWRMMLLFICVGFY
jgi:hypothetical protein